MWWCSDEALITSKKTQEGSCRSVIGLQETEGLDRWAPPSLFNATSSTHATVLKTKRKLGYFPEKANRDSELQRVLSLRFGRVYLLFLVKAFLVTVWYAETSGVENVCDLEAAQDAFDLPPTGTLAGRSRAAAFRLTCVRRAKTSLPAQRHRQGNSRASSLTSSKSNI